VTLDQMMDGVVATLTQLPIDAQFVALNAIRARLHAASPNAAQPVDYVRWLPVGQVVANHYNPNQVASPEMGLLQTSIQHDGYTQPVVACWDNVTQKAVIVDGFHRSAVMSASPSIATACHGHLPVVLIDKGINDRMASTVRHNRARGRHAVSGMANMVFALLDQGWDDAAVCRELGLTPEEVVRLKHITGFSKLFADTRYHRAWITKQQIQIRATQHTLTP
jgi:ParB-like chromosome segregation protein Spo0J